MRHSYLRIGSILKRTYTFHTIHISISFNNPDTNTHEQGWILTFLAGAHCAPHFENTGAQPKFRGREMYVRRSKHLEISRNSLIVAKMYVIMTKERFKIFRQDFTLKIWGRSLKSGGRGAPDPPLVSSPARESFHFVSAILNHEITGKFPHICVYY